MFKDDYPEYPERPEYWYISDARAYDLFTKYPKKPEWHISHGDEFDA